jgi:hypothetical protein
VTQIPETGAGSTRVVVRVAALRFGLLNDIIIFLLFLVFLWQSHPAGEKIIGAQNIYFMEPACRSNQLLVWPCVAGSYIWKMKKKILPWHMRTEKTVIAFAPLSHA